MEKRNPHAAALERIGYDRIKGHFGISRQTYWQWRSTGVPSRHLKSVKVLGALAGIETPEISA